MSAKPKRRKDDTWVAQIKRGTAIALAAIGAATIIFHAGIGAYVTIATTWHSAVPKR